MIKHSPYVPASTHYPELTLKVYVLGFLLAALLAASNAYIGLKMGRTVSGSIPAAVISVAVLHWFRNRNILEHNLIQTAASAGECLAAGIIFTIPALLMLGVWDSFSYWDTLLIGIIGGSLGVLFSVPLRKTMIVEQKLPYPEGIAVAEILRTTEEQSEHKEQKSGVSYLLQGGFFASLFTLCQTGFKLIGDSITVWTQKLGVLYGFGFGFSPVLLAAGYIVGIGIASTIALGTATTWMIGVPVLSLIYPDLAAEPALAVTILYKEHLRYASIGTLTFGGIWGLISLYKPIIEAVKASCSSLGIKHQDKTPRTDRDIPMSIVLGVIAIMTVPLFFIFYRNIEAFNLPITSDLLLIVVVISTVFAILLGFIASAIASYLVGLVGTSSLPISGLAIASITFMAVLMIGIVGTQLSFNHPDYAAQGAGITILFASIICLSASLGGDNMQDLRAGYALGATPWKQQFILFVGVIAGSLVIVPVLELLLNAYGIGDILPHEGMDPEKTLLAPQATIMAAVAEGVFLGEINKLMFSLGVIIAIVVALIDRHLEKSGSRFRLPVLAFGLGMYLPMSMVTALFIGGLLSLALHRHFKKDANAERRGILVAAGLIAGEALTGIVLAVPFSLSPLGENVLKIPTPLTPEILSILGLLSFTFLMYLIYRNVTKR